MLNIILYMRFLNETETVENLLFVACTGLIGAVVYLYIKQELKQQKTQKFIQELNDKYILKIESSSEVSVNLLEKTLNGLTQVETSLSESKGHITKEVIQAIKETNAPLIKELEKAIEKIKNHE